MKLKSIIKADEDTNAGFHLEMVPAGIQRTPNIQFLHTMYLEISR